MNARPCGTFATIGATGLGRSGTTMVSRVMKAVGVDMGQCLTDGSGEDETIRNTIRAKDRLALSQYCRVRNKAAPIWGFKVPAFRGNMDRYGVVMREPRYIITFRDTLAIALRHTMTSGQDLISVMRNSVADYEKILTQLATTSTPVMLISYEKALQYPENTVLEISRFCGCEVGPDKAREIAAATIQNGDPLYWT